MSSSLAVDLLGILDYIIPTVTSADQMFGNGTTGPAEWDSRRQASRDRWSVSA